MARRTGMRATWLASIFICQALVSTASGVDFEVVARDGSPVANALVSHGKGAEPQQIQVMDQVDKAFAPYDVRDSGHFRAEGDEGTGAAAL